MLIIKKILLSILIIFPTLTFCFESSDELIKNFELRFYSPANFGIKDLVFDLEIPAVKEYIAKNMNVSKPENVQFRIYWVHPDKSKVEVLGLSVGMQEIQQILKNMVQPRLDYVIPEKLSKLLDGYTLSLKKADNKFIISADDKTGKRDVIHMQLVFNKDGMLLEHESVGSFGHVKTDFKMSTKAWSHNKWVLDEVLAETQSGPMITKVQSSLVYEVIEGHGLPTKVSIKTDRNMNNPTSVNKGTTRDENTTELIYKNYEVNSGRAQRAISQ